MKVRLHQRPVTSPLPFIVVMGIVSIGAEWTAVRASASVCRWPLGSDGRKVRRS